MTKEDVIIRIKSIFLRFNKVWNVVQITDSPFKSYSLSILHQDELNRI